jgi:CspA family cold shock protein
MDGRVKWWIPSKGYGFIVANDGPKGEPMTEIFVHYKDILGDGRKDLVGGQLVEFHVRQTPRGPRATDVTIPAHAK